MNCVIKGDTEQFGERRTGESANMESAEVADSKSGVKQIIGYPVALQLVVV